MSHAIEGAARTARTGSHRQQIASLAHATAHEVCALRTARDLIQPSMDASDVQRLLDGMIDSRQHTIALMADRVVGHA